MQIYYCDSCGMRVSTDAFSSGEAVLKGDIATCSKCLQTRAPVHSPKPGGSGRTRIPSAIAEAPIAAARVKTNAPKAAKQNSIPTIVLVIVPLVILAWFLVLRKPASFVAPDTDARKSAPLDKPVAEAPRERLPAQPAKIAPETQPPKTNAAAIANADAEIQKVRHDHATKLLQSAKDFAAANPADFVACKDKYLEVVMAYRDSPAAVEAIRLLAEMKTPPTVAVAPTVAPVPTVPQPAAPVTPPVLDVNKTAASSNPAPQTISPDSKVLYSAVAAEIYALLASEQIAAARQRLAQAQADAQLAPVHSLLKLDAQLMELLPKTRTDAAKGAELLTDKREFVFVKNDGKQLRVGGNSGSVVQDVKDGIVQLELSLGGGAKAQMKLDIAQLTSHTQYELAKLALPKTPESELQLGYVAMLLQTGGIAKNFPNNAAQEHLRKAELGDAQKESALHLEARLIAQKSEAAADAAMKNLEIALRDKKWTDARKMLEAFKLEHANSILFSQRKKWIDEKLEAVVLQLSPLAPKLWSSYWKHLNGEAFKEFQFARAESTLNTESTMLPPSDKMEFINFGVRFQGLLRIQTDGKYRLKGRADDFMTVWIDDKQVLKAIVSISVTESEVALTKGDHKIKIDFQQDGGSWSYGLQWQLPGANDFTDIPENALWHDPKMIEQYKKE